MADITPDLISAVQGETDQWAAWLRDEVLNAEPGTAGFAAKMAAAVSCLHPGMAGLGSALITAARCALICRDLTEENGCDPVTTDGLANLIGAAGLMLIKQEQEAGRDG